MQEDIDSLPLYLNPVLEPLAICLARGMFRDFETADQIFAPEPTESEPCYELVLCPPTLALYESETEKSPHITVSTLKPLGLAPRASKASTAAGQPVGGTPSFEALSDKGPTGKMLSSNWLDNGLVAAGRRAGYGERISIHDCRAEALVVADGK
jgi:hypothetical protein